MFEEMKSEMKADSVFLRKAIQDIQDDRATLRTEMQADRDALRTEMQADRDALRTEMNSGFTQMQQDFKALDERVKKIEGQYPSQNKGGKTSGKMSSNLEEKLPQA